MYMVDTFNWHQDFVLYEYLKYKGVKDVDSFLHPTEAVLTDPYELTNLKKAIELINKYEDIYIQIDPDADGYCSAAILYLYLKFMNKNVTYGLPQGKKHELNFEAIQGYDGLIIIPDAGTNDQYPIPNEVLVLDHHIVERSTNALLVSNRWGHSNPSLSGAGVVHKLCLALDEYFHCDYAQDLFDLAALGMKSDMSDVRHPEIQYYFNKMKYPTTPWFKQACKEFIKDKITPKEVAWKIAPMINATVRVGTDEEKDELFKSMVGLSDKGFDVMRECKKRQTKLIEKEKPEIISDESIVIASCENKEVRGLLANKLAREYRKPILVLGTNSGSARNHNNSFSFKEFLDQSELAKCAGHDNAFGVEIQEIEALVKYCNENLVNDYKIDGEFDINNKVLKIIADEFGDCEFWGDGLKEPVFLITGLDQEPWRVMGVKRMTCKLEKNNMTLISLQSRKVVELAEENKLKKVLAFPSNNWYNEIRYLQYTIERPVV